jgi:hypothetical protein
MREISTIDLFMENLPGNGRIVILAEQPTHISNVSSNFFLFSLLFIAMTKD